MAALDNPYDHESKKLGIPGYSTEGQLSGFEVAALFSSSHSLYCWPPIPFSSTVAETTIAPIEGPSGITNTASSCSDCPGSNHPEVATVPRSKIRPSSLVTTTWVRMPGGTLNEPSLPTTISKTKWLSSQSSLEIPRTTKSGASKSPPG